MSLFYYRDIIGFNSKMMVYLILVFFDRYAKVLSRKEEKYEPVRAKHLERMQNTKSVALLALQVGSVMMMIVIMCNDNKPVEGHYD